MKIHNVIQGTQEWLNLRKGYFSASDAPAMLGISPHKTRTELLKEKATGLSAEVNAHTQMIFDKGHKFEDLARQNLAEKIVGEDLFPCVGSSGKLLASFDGLTMAGDIAWEHKMLNDDLRTVMAEGSDGHVLPEHYQAQMEHQMIVSGAQKVLFSATAWDEDGALIEARHCWYTSRPDLRKRILAGWEQFELDLTNYKAEPVAVQAVGRDPGALPALRVEIKGEVVANNLPEYKDHIISLFRSINRDLKTDQDFADAEKTVKWCKEVEDRLETEKKRALGQTKSIDDVLRAFDDISAEVRATRLELDRLVKARKDAIREEIRQGAINALRDHYESINSTLGMGVSLAVPGSFGLDVANAMRGKRTVASLKDAADSALAAAKIEATQHAQRVRKNIEILQSHLDHAFLFSDGPSLALHKEPETLELIVKQRIADHKTKEQARLEAERERIRQEEAAKLMVEEPAVDLPFRPVEVKQVHSARNERPSDRALVKCIAKSYGVPESKALSWLMEINYSELAEEIEATV